MVFDRFQGVGKRFKTVLTWFSMITEFAVRGTVATGLRKMPQNPGSQILSSTQLLRSVRPVLELFEDPGPSIQGEATQMARNITSLGIELGRALCWGRGAGAHFCYKDTAACRSFSTRAHASTDFQQGQSNAL